MSRIGILAGLNAAALALALTADQQHRREPARNVQKADKDWRRLEELRLKRATEYGKTAIAAAQAKRQRKRKK